MLVYLAIVVVFCAIYPIVPRKHIRWLFLALVLALSIMAFYMKPYETDDIGNYFNQVSMLRKGGFSTLRRCIQNGDNHWDSLPVCGFYFYLISLFPDNGMLPAVTIFLAYGSMFWVLWRASQRYEVNKWYLFVASFFILSTYWFYDICSGIRNGLTFTLFCLFAYVELVEKKYKPACWLGYLAMCLMHSSGILMMMIRIALLLSGKKNSKFMSVLVFFAMILFFELGKTVLREHIVIKTHIRLFDTVKDLVCPIINLCAVGIIHCFFTVLSQTEDRAAALLTLTALVKRQHHIRNELHSAVVVEQKERIVIGELFPCANGNIFM